MDAIECIKTRRSIRKFQDKPVSHELLSEIVETASYSPSWKHTQIVRYVVVEGDLKARFADECTKIWAGNGPIIHSAAALVAVTIVKNRSGFERDGSFSTPKGTGWQMFDAGVASQTFCLAAHEKGLGTVILGLYDEEDATKMLELPEDRELVCLIPVGYPAEEPVCPRRKPVEELISYK